MNYNYTMERKGQFWVLREGTRIIYKSKDKSKVKYKYELLEGNRVDKELKSHEYGYGIPTKTDITASMLKYK